MVETPAVCQNHTVKRKEKGHFTQCVSHETGHVSGKNHGLLIQITGNCVLLSVYFYFGGGYSVTFYLALM